jgi:hypothetical protein
MKKMTILLLFTGACSGSRFQQLPDKSNIPVGWRPQQAIPMQSLGIGLPLGKK